MPGEGSGMSEEPLVSVVIPTLNSARTLKCCLETIRSQTYKNVEIIVVDAGSTDETLSIVRALADTVLVKDLRRSAARNYGVAHAKGEYVLILDSDMYLTEGVISDCIAKFNDERARDLAGIVIPEKSIGEGFWAKVKALEREFYQGVPFMEAARFFPRSLYEELGGYNENLDSGEDWEFSQRVMSKGRIEWISSHILHDEGRVKISSLWKKKSFYGASSIHYMSMSEHRIYHRRQFGLAFRIALFFRKPELIFRYPILWMMVFVLKALELTAWKWGRFRGRTGA
jgi:glycosyltransferase involved in cell wall biosynthesis